MPETPYEDYEAAPLPEPIEADPGENVEGILRDALRDHTFGVIRTLVEALEEQTIDPVRGLFLIEHEARMARQHFAELDPDAGPNGDDDEGGYGAVGGMVGNYGQRRIGIRAARGRGRRAGGMLHGNEEFRQMMPALTKQADAAMEGKLEGKIRALTNSLGDAKDMARKAKEAGEDTTAEDALIARLQSRLDALLDSTEPVKDPTFPETNYDRAVASGAVATPEPAPVNNDNPEDNHA
jgi:hypothetical protein